MTSSGTSLTITTTSTCLISGCSRCLTSKFNIIILGSTCSYCRTGYYLKYGKCYLNTGSTTTISISTGTSGCLVAYCLSCSIASQYSCNVCMSGYYKSNFKCYRSGTTASVNIFKAPGSFIKMGIIAVILLIAFVI